MSTIDVRGFDYALEPARQRAHHRVDAAMGSLGLARRALSQALEREEALRHQCAEVARRSLPAQHGTIDPARATAASHEWLRVRTALAGASRETQEKQEAADKAQAHLNDARREQESFDTHRADALAEHQLAQVRRQQMIADQDWLARRQLAGMGHAGESGA